VTNFNLIQALRSWFFGRDGDIVLQSGRTIVVTSPGVSITIDDNGIVITGGDVTIDGTSVSVSGHTHTHASTTGKTANDHHNESHTVASHSDTTGTGSELNTLTDGSDAGSLHIHDARYFQESEFSSNPGAASAPLETDGSGDITLQVVDVNSLIVTSGVLQLEERSTPGTPPSGYGRVYFKAGGTLHYINDAGTEEEVATV
jgi:hypothetical protein